MAFNSNEEDVINIAFFKGFLFSCCIFSRKTKRNGGREGGRDREREREREVRKEGRRIG